MNKKKVIGIVLVVVLVLVLIGGVLYFTKSNKQTINDLKVKYEGGSSVKINGKDSTLEKEIVITNTSDDLRTYKLSWEDVSNDFGSDLVYQISCTGERCAKLDMSQVPAVSSTIYNSVAIPKGVTHTYKIKFTKNGSNEGTFKGNLKVSSYEVKDDDKSRDIEKDMERKEIEAKDKAKDIEKNIDSKKTEDNSKA